jgi:hypothetical protein
MERLLDPPEPGPSNRWGGGGDRRDDAIGVARRVVALPLARLARSFRTASAVNDPFSCQIQVKRLRCA